MSDIQPENNEELKNSVEPNDAANEKTEEPTEEIKIESAEEKVEEINKISELEDKIKSLQDTLLRKAADFENYKRRTENDQLNLLKYAAESFILKVLPIYDDLNRSVQHLGEDSFESVKEGLKLIFDKFTKILEEQGIKKIDAKGQEFNVEFHEALLQQPSKEFPANTVIEEVDPGYIYKDRVIKHSKVIVSKEVEE
ncbi:MAG: nucleotide exchange factor GrpE [Ignavibacteriales bacterium]|nr:nucleotide exchange factor GrpE [Ignavibacteriales bacterium]MBK7980525.1 nucleotide exchange factor GrpE [Ignavibacteriota bacterium]